MKKLLIIASILFAGSAFAGVDKDSSWKSIQDDASVFTAGPLASMLKYCQSGENVLRTIEKVVTWENVGHGRQEKWEKVESFRFLPITYIQYTCHKRSCEDNDMGDHTGMTPYKVTRKLEGMIDVRAARRNERKLFSKYYRVSTCN